MTGNLRSWITYCITRCEAGTQLEHRLIGNECWKILREQCPNIAKFVEDEYEYLKEI
jgi:thymidylate synthase ThyX